jgi:hypothetical protein
MNRFVVLFTRFCFLHRQPRERRRRRRRPILLAPNLARHPLLSRQEHHVDRPQRRLSRSLRRRSVRRRVLSRVRQDDVSLLVHASQSTDKGASVAHDASRLRTDDVAHRAVHDAARRRARRTGRFDASTSGGGRSSPPSRVTGGASPRGSVAARRDGSRWSCSSRRGDEKHGRVCACVMLFYTRSDAPAAKRDAQSLGRPRRFCLRPALRSFTPRTERRRCIC